MNGAKKADIASVDSSLPNIFREAKNDISLIGQNIMNFITKLIIIQT